MKSLLEHVHDVVRAGRHRYPSSWNAHSQAESRIRTYMRLHRFPWPPDATVPPERQRILEHHHSRSIRRGVNRFCVEAAIPWRFAISDWDAPFAHGPFRASANPPPHAQGPYATRELYPTGRGAHAGAGLERWVGREQAATQRRQLAGDWRRALRFWLPIADWSVVERSIETVVKRCLQHEDCRLHLELGKACLKDKMALTLPVTPPLVAALLGGPR